MLQGCADPARHPTRGVTAAQSPDRATGPAPPRPADRPREPAGTRPVDARCLRADSAREHRAIALVRPPLAPAAPIPPSVHPPCPSATPAATRVRGAAGAALARSAARTRRSFRSSTAFAPLPRSADRACAAAVRELEVDLALVDDHVDEPYAQVIAEP